MREDIQQTKIRIRLFGLRKLAAKFRGEAMASSTKRDFTMASGDWAFTRYKGEKPCQWALFYQGIWVASARANGALSYPANPYYFLLDDVERAADAAAGVFGLQSKELVRVDSGEYK